MSGILNYKNYLNTLQTVTEVGNIFPNEQKTWTFSIEGGGQQGWTAEISWLTLVVDKINWDKNDRPVFTDSNVFGYYEGGTASQFSSGVISIPANMYTGPILPSSDYWVPITVVNIKWSNSGTTFANNLALIQNWEPGVQPESPVYGNDFIPIVKEPSTLTLTAPGAVVWQRPLTLVATTDIPIFLGSLATAYFWWDKPGGRVLLGTALFDDNSKSATLVYDTNNLIQPATPSGDIYPIYAEFSGVRQYGKQRTSSVNQVILGHIPLVVESESFTPSKSTYAIGDTLVYGIKFKPDPSFPVTGEPVSNFARVYRRDKTIAGSPDPANRPDVLIASVAMNNGNLSIPQPITSDLVDTSDYFTYADKVTVTTSTLISNVYNATIEVESGYSFYINYDADLNGPYKAGTKESVRYIATATVNRTYVGQAFPISISRSPVDSYQTEPVTFTLTTPNRFYAGVVSLIGSTVIDGDVVTSTLTTFPFGTKTRSVVFNTTGTWTIYASFPGDLGTSYLPNRINLASTSNTLSHFVREGNVLRTELAFERTTSTDIIRIIGYFAGQLPKEISFYQGTNLLTTATWTRATSTQITYDPVLRSLSKVVRPANFSDKSAGWPFYWANTTENYRYNQISYWPLVNPNKYMLYRYKDASESTSSYLSNPLDPHNIINPKPTRWEDSSLSVGDPRGYNVIGFDDNRAPETNYFPRTITITGQGRRWFESYTITLTLVEYLGEVTNPAYKSQGATSRKLFRFTPAIIQSTDLFNIFAYERNYPGADFSGIGAPVNYQYNYPLYPTYVSSPGQTVVPLPPGSPTGIAGKTYLDLSNGQIYRSEMWPRVNGAIQWYGVRWVAQGRLTTIDTWNIYGKKEYPITNSNDPVLSQNQNNGLVFFNGVTSSGSTVEIDEFYEQVPDITSVFRNTNYAIVYLPLNTVTDVDELRATWPGTLDLGFQFGKFYPTETFSTGAPTTTLISSRFDVVKANYFDDDERHGSTLTNIVYATNPVILKAEVLVNPDLGTSTAGSVNFYNADNNTLIGNAVVIDRVAELSVVANDLSSISQTVNVKAVFDGTLSADSTSTNWAMQCINSDYNLADFTFHDRPPFQWFDTTLEPVPKFNARWNEPIAPAIVRHTVQTFFKNSYSGKTGSVNVNGSLQLLIPFCNYRGYFNYTQPASPVYGYRVFEPGGYSYPTPYGISNFYENGPSTIVFLLYAQINYANGSTAIVPVNRTTSLGHSYKYQTYTGVAPVARSITYNSNTLPVTWANDWISIDLYLDVAGWEFASNNSDSSLASIAPGSKLGYKSFFNI
jgi:hypothetical protein